MRVLIVGDVHGQHQRLGALLRQVRVDYRIEAAIQVGDFGFSRAGLAGATAAALPFPVPLHVIDGNHDDHAWLHRALRAGAADAWKRDLNLIYQARGSVARLGGSKAGFLGGALHVDRPQRHGWRGRWSNYIPRRQREEAARCFNAEQPELIVTHSCPARIGIGMRGSETMAFAVAENIRAAGFDPGPPDDCGETELSHLWRDLRYRPRAWVFGHFHGAHQADIEGTRFACVDNDSEAPGHPLILWDTEERRLLSVPADPSAVPAPGPRRIR